MRILFSFAVSFTFLHCSRTLNLLVMEPLENTIPRRFQRQQHALSDHWSDDYSSEKSPAYAKTENSSAAWSLRDDSNAELVVPQVMIQSLGTRQDIGHLRVIVCGDSGGFDIE